MKKGWIQTFKRLTLVLTILVSFIAVLQAGILSWRPMFYNQLVMHDGMPFLHWWPQGPYLDDSGNAAIADYHRNLLVIFVVSGSKIDTQRFWYPRSGHGGAIFPTLHTQDTIDFFVPETSNALYVFGEDGSRWGFPLAVGESERIHKLIRSRRDAPSDLASLLQEVYSEKHATDHSARLRATVDRLLRRGENRRW
jgi:hypothetical protein